MKRDDVYYQAMLTRDHRFDGKFFVGVKTTGIYCRPICPAKPLRKNIEFFQNSAEAERAGYRPCLRCRPESAPRSPAWIGTSAIVRRAVKVLHNQNAIEFKEEEFAALFGVSARHLRRLFIEELGKTPKQLAFEDRLNLARKLIVETELNVGEVAFAAGFNSIRRFNDAFKLRFKKNPSEIRRRPLKTEGGLMISIPYRPPFDFESLMHFYQSHRVGELESFEDGLMHRVITSGGKSGWVHIGNDPKNSRVLVEIDFPNTSVIPDVVARVRTLFDLESDPLVVANALETDTAMKKLLQQYPGIRVPSGWDAFEVSIATILGQLVSVDRARRLVSDLIQIAGHESGLEKDGRAIQLFPTPEQIAKADLTTLGTTQIRKQTLIAFAEAILDQTISLEPTQNVEEFVEKLLKVRGIGPWTANYMAMKALRDADSFPGTDLILARALEIHSPELVQKMRPWRSYAATLFWRAYAGKLKAKPKLTPKLKLKRSRV